MSGKGIRGTILALAGIVGPLCANGAGRLPLSETLIELKPDYRPSWTTWEKQPWEVGEDLLVMRSLPDQMLFVRSWRWMRGTRVYFPDYCVSGRFQISFEYRNTAEKGVAVRTELTGMLYHEKYPKCELGGFRTELAKADDWTPFEETFTMKTPEWCEAGITFGIPKGNEKVEVRKFRLVELPPETARRTDTGNSRRTDTLVRSDGKETSSQMNGQECPFSGANGQECPFSEEKPLVVGGREMKEIVLQTSDDEMILRNERRAAMMIRYALVKAGYKYLPIREVGRRTDTGNSRRTDTGNSRRTDTLVRSDGKETSSQTNGQECPFSGANGQECPFFDVAGRILVGRAAEGLFSAAELEQIRTKEGTGAYAVRNGAVGVTGNLPGGPQYGAFRFLGAIGIEYIATDRFSVEPCTLGDTSFVYTPAIPYRDSPGRLGAYAELYGLTPKDDLVGNIAVGSGDKTADPEWGIQWFLAHDSLGFVVPMTEFDETHPEYFALQKDGSRLNAKTAKLGHAQFCWSNPELRKLVTARYIEIMRGNPGAKFFFFTPGDGGGRNCHCADCLKSGNSTALVKLMNEIGRETGKVYPDKRLISYSYATTLEAPEVDAVDPHVKFTDSLYMPSHWGASHWFEHPANAKGMKALADWRKVMPDIGAMLYYQNCRDWCDLWPAFRGWVAAERDFAAHGANFIDRTYTHDTCVAGCIPAPSACFGAAHYILPRVDVDPNYDVEAGLAHWFPKFYGSAAKDMRAYFDLCNEQVVKQDWVQNTEWGKRGFTTVEFVDRGEELLLRAIATAEKTGDEKLVRNLKMELLKLQWAFVRDFNRGRGNLTEELYPKWAERVASVLRLMPEVKHNLWTNVHGVFNNLFLYALEKPNRRDWWNMPQLMRVKADPVGELGGLVPNVQEKTAAGARIPAKGWVGGEWQPRAYWKVNGQECPFSGKPFGAVLVRRESSGKGLVRTQLRLETVPADGITLKLRGIDGPTDGPGQIEVKVNGTVVHAGAVPWSKTIWGESAWKVPAKLLKTGVNDVTVRNVTPDFEKDGDCGAAFAVKRNYFRGWFLMSDLEW